MPCPAIDRLIGYSPDKEPTRHRRYDRTTRLLNLEEGGRPADYWGRSEAPPRSTTPACFARFRPSSRFVSGSRHGARVDIGKSVGAARPFDAHRRQSNRDVYPDQASA